MRHQRISRIILCVLGWNDRKCSRKKVAFEPEPEICQSLSIKEKVTGHLYQSVSQKEADGTLQMEPCQESLLLRDNFQSCGGEKPQEPGWECRTQGCKSCTTANHRLERMCNFQNPTRGSHMLLDAWKGTGTTGRGTKPAWGDYRTGVRNTWSDFILLPLISCRGCPIGQTHLEAEGKENPVMSVQDGEEWRGGLEGPSKGMCPRLKRSHSIDKHLTLECDGLLKEEWEAEHAYNPQKYQMGDEAPLHLRLGLAVRGLYSSLRKGIRGLSRNHPAMYYEK